MNCQTVAATLAVIISNNGFATLDALKYMDFFNAQSLFVPLYHLKHNYKTHWLDPRLADCVKSIASSLYYHMGPDKKGLDAGIANSLIRIVHYYSRRLKTDIKDLQPSKRQLGWLPGQVLVLCLFFSAFSKEFVPSTLMEVLNQVDRDRWRSSGAV